MNGPHIGLLTAKLTPRLTKALERCANTYGTGGSLLDLSEALQHRKPPAGIGAKTRYELLTKVVAEIMFWTSQNREAVDEQEKRQEARQRFTDQATDSVAQFAIQAQPDCCLLIAKKDGFLGGFAPINLEKADVYEMLNMFKALVDNDLAKEQQQQDEVERLKQALHDARLENSGQALAIERLKEAQQKEVQG